MSINIGEPKELMNLSIEMLNKLLADEFVMLAKSWNFHWNVVGPSFGSYHAFLEKIYTEAFNNIDEIAERIKALDGIPYGTLKMYVEHARIKEYCIGETVPDAKTMFEILLEDYETIIREVRADLKTLEVQKVMDEETISFLQDMIYRLGKTCWMIRAHLG